MERFFVRLLLFFIITLSSSTLLAHGTIIITNVEHSEGYIDVKIYKDKETFLKEELATETIRKKATNLVNSTDLSYAMVYKLTQYLSLREEGLSSLLLQHNCEQVKYINSLLTSSPHLTLKLLE